MVGVQGVANVKKTMESFLLGGNSAAASRQNQKRQSTILIAEDDVQMIFLLEKALRFFAYPSFIVPSGIGVLQYLGHLGPYAEPRLFPTPGLLLLNTTLPFMDGFEVLRAIRSNPSFADLPVIMSSDFDHPDYVRHAYDMGASSYVVKPRTLAGVTSLVGMVLMKKGRFDGDPHPNFYRPPIPPPTFEWTEADN
jgi:DNA-binding response OmpR family regulator